MLVGLSLPLYLEQIHTRAQRRFCCFLRRRLHFYSQGPQLQRDSVFPRPALWFDLHGETVEPGRRWDVVVKRNLGKKKSRGLLGGR